MQTPTGKKFFYFLFFPQKFKNKKISIKNRRCAKGRTPLHAAAINGDLKTLNLLVRNGGDYRLHDDDGKSVKDFVLLLEKADTKKDMLQFIDDINEMTILQATKSQQTSICPSLTACIQNEHNVNDYATVQNVTLSLFGF